MELVYIKGNLLDGSHEVVVNPVNCVGIMGAGVALQFKRRYPEMFQSYIEHCRYGLMDKHVHVSYQKLDSTVVVNLATKYHWKNNSDLELIKHQLGELAYAAEVYGFDVISMPRIGCGLGNLSWSDVEPLIVNAFTDTNITIQIIDLEGR